MQPQPEQLFMLCNTFRTPGFTKFRGCEAGNYSLKDCSPCSGYSQGCRGARKIDDKMAEARRIFDWETQWQCAIDPKQQKIVLKGSLNMKIPVPCAASFVQ